MADPLETPPPVASGERPESPRASSTKPPGVMRIAAQARQAVAFFTELPIDAVASCKPAPPGWIAHVDVVESRARLGDNDLIATYEVRLTQAGEVEGLTRLRRYRRDTPPEEIA